LAQDSLHGVSHHARITFGDKTSDLIRVRKEVSRGHPSKDNYRIETSAGNVLDVVVPRATGKPELVLDRGVIGGPYNPFTARINRDALDKLVQATASQPSKPFATCSTSGSPGRFSKTVDVTVRPGLREKTAIFEAKLGDSGDAGHVTYVADRYIKEGATGRFFTRFEGGGNHLYVAAGTHVHEVTRMWLSTTTISPNEVKLAWDSANDDALPELRDCTVDKEGMNAVKKYIPSIESPNPGK
jgi:hypothetical protein